MIFRLFLSQTFEILDFRLVVGPNDLIQYPAVLFDVTRDNERHQPALVLHSPKRVEQWFSMLAVVQCLVKLEKKEEERWYRIICLKSHHLELPLMYVSILMICISLK